MNLSAENTSSSPAEGHGAGALTGSEPDEQSVLYALAVSAILIVAVSVAHLVSILIFRLLSKSALQPIFRFPCFEVSRGKCVVM